MVVVAETKTFAGINRIIRTSIAADGFGMIGTKQSLEIAVQRE
jgi:hypothetical protein